MNQERSFFDSTEIPWPKDVTEDDLAKINNRLKNDESPATSAALVLCEEAYQLAYECDYAVYNLQQTKPEITLAEKIKIIKITHQLMAYLAFAEYILCTDYHVRKGQSPPTIALETPQIFLRLLEAIDPKLVYVFEGKDKENWIPPEEIVEAFKTRNISGFLNSVFDWQVKQPYKDLETVTSCIEGMKQSKQRFHQLYQAAQEAGL